MARQFQTEEGFVNAATDGREYLMSSVFYVDGAASMAGTLISSGLVGSSLLAGRLVAC